MARPGLRPLVMEDEATWYIEMLNASAIQNPSNDGHVHVLSLELEGTGSRSLFDERIELSLPGGDDTVSVCKRKRSMAAGAIAFIQDTVLLDWGKKSYAVNSKGEN